MNHSHFSYSEWCECSRFPMKHKHASFMGSADRSQEALLDVAEMASQLDCEAPASCIHCDAVKAIAQAEGGK